MYTRKQAWRRVNSRNIQATPGSAHDDYILRRSLKKSVSENDIVSESCKYVSDQELCAKSKTYEPDSKNRKVRFNGAARVVLVPNLREYKTEGVHTDVWWMKSELSSFKMNAKLEFVELVERCNGQLSAALDILHGKWPEQTILDSDFNEMGSPTFVAKACA